MTTLIPKIIHHTSGVLSLEEKLIIHRSKKLFKDWVFHYWDDNDNEALFIELLPEYAEEYKSIKKGVIKADICRCLYLYKYGGVYVDTDYKFYKLIDDDLLSHGCILAIEESENKSVVGVKLGNAFMASKPGFELWIEFVRTMFVNLAKNKDVVNVGGPHALSDFLQKNIDYNEEILILEQNIIYPDFKMFGFLSKKSNKTIGFHMCWGSWRNKSLLLSIKNKTRRLVTSII